MRRRCLFKSVSLTRYLEVKIRGRGKMEGKTVRREHLLEKVTNGLKDPNKIKGKAKMVLNNIAFLQ